ncbi:splicing factor, arginine/serine-rich 8, putative [Babesia caballi]|uniref:Splicing factor, arginine/serine-rich 8, putative n=1 Tax=Babesia caballi TaxID=5871 RepID=A0AAV4LQS7_BABCB|nr:splicing factor, arginine/serine-rich 8, putative [Babesia caballi]
MEDQELQLPPQLLRSIPAGQHPGRAALLDMAYTACAARKEGDSFEFRLKIHPESDRVAFLEPSHPFHECYMALKRNEGGALAEIVSKWAPDNVRQLFLDAPEPTPRGSGPRSEAPTSDQRASPPTPATTSRPSPASRCIVHGYSDSD